MLIVLYCVVLLLGISCGTTSSRSLSDFDFLRAGMSYEEITERVGQADSVGGSGFIIMSYELNDGKTLSLSFATLESLLSASVYDPTDDTREFLNIEE
jgi:hypothetical protein